MTKESTPTAEEILNQYKTMNWSHEYAENGILSVQDAKEAMREIASLSWEASAARFNLTSKSMDKESFMKKLFPE